MSIWVVTGTWCQCWMLYIDDLLQSSWGVNNIVPILQKKKLEACKTWVVLRWKRSWSDRWNWFTQPGLCQLECTPLCVIPLTALLSRDGGQGHQYLHTDSLLLTSRRAFALQLTPGEGLCELLRAALPWILGLGVPALLLGSVLLSCQALSSRREQRQRGVHHVPWATTALLPPWGNNC